MAARAGMIPGRSSGATTARSPAVNFILPPIPRVFSYRRVSSPRQLWGSGLKRQEEDGVIAVEAVSKEFGLPVDDTLSLVDRGLSGFTGANLPDTAALGMFLKMVENREIARDSILCIEALDRLTRDEVPEALHLFLSIQRKGVRIYTWGDKKLYSSEGMSKEPTLLIVSFMAMTFDPKRATAVAKRMTHV